MSIVARDSSVDLNNIAELTILSEQSIPNPALSSLLISPEAIAPSTAARPPQPIPSLMSI